MVLICVKSLKCFLLEDFIAINIAASAGESAVVGGMAGGAVGNTVSYVGTNLMMNGNFGSFEGGLVAFGTGALSGAAGGSAAYGLGDGLIGTTAGGSVGSRQAHTSMEMVYPRLR